MTQISRPFAIAIAAVVLFAAVWFVALKPHAASTSSEASSSSATSAQVSAQQEKSAAAPSKVDHTKIPGVEGLTKDINRAHGAVAATQRTDQHIEQKAAQASGTSSTSTAPAAPPSSAKPATSPAASASAPRSSAAGAAAAGSVAKSAAPAKSQGAQATKPSSGSSQGSSSHIPAGQASVEAALKEGKVALLFFWNPASPEDQSVHTSVALIAGLHEIFESLSTGPKSSRQVQGSSLGPIAVFESGASAVASFGTLTRTVQVNQTPTILIVNPAGQITSIPGYTESAAIAQRLSESRQAGEQAQKKAAEHAAK